MPITYSAPPSAQTEDPAHSGTRRTPTSNEPADRVNKLAAAMTEAVSSVSALETSVAGKASTAVVTSTTNGLMIAVDKVKLDSGTSTGLAVFQAASSTAARTAIGAGTSNLAIGTTSTTAKAGDYQPTAANISDSTLTGRQVLTATDGAAARTAIGAGTSSLALGSTGSTAMAGNATTTAVAEGSNLYFTDARVRAVYPTIRSVTASTTLVLSDEIVRVNSSSAATVTVPANASVAFPVGTVVQVRRNGSGTVGVVASAGVTINGLLTGAPQFASYSLLKAGTNEWDIEGGGS